MVHCGLNHAALPERRNLRRVIPQFGQHKIGMLAERRWTCRDFARGFRQPDRCACDQARKQVA